jgi:NAD+ synthase
MKSDVYALGKYLTIPDSIQTAAPTDGLFGDNRTDEDQLGASYDELEWAMLENEKEMLGSNYSEREDEVLKIFYKLNNSNKHKMLPIPICIIPMELK